MKTVYQLKCKYMKTIESQGWGDRLTTTYRLYFNEVEYSRINPEVHCSTLYPQSRHLPNAPIPSIKTKGDLFYIDMFVQFQHVNTIIFVFFSVFTFSIKKFLLNNSLFVFPDSC